MIGLMSAMATLMLCLGLTLDTWMGPAAASLRDTLSVQIPAQANREQAEKRVAAALERLPEARNVRLLSDTEVTALVRPWLGLDDAALNHLDLPAVFEVSLTHQAGDASALQRQLNTLAPGTTVDTQAEWAEKFARLTHAVQIILYALAASIVAALTGMMVFTSRAAMKLHAGTVRMLHAIGADDSYIARQFQQNALALSLRGAVPGVCAAGLGYAALGFYISRLDAPALPPLTLTFHHLAMLAALPFACACVAWVAVRIATFAQLSHLP